MMNNNILKKCLEELSKEKPDISYVRGMLETLSELNQPEVNYPVVRQLPTLGSMSPKTTAPSEVKPSDEGSLLDATAKANLEKVKEMAQKSVTQ